jgi:hypothetical protein
MDIFDCIESFFRRLELHVAAPMTGAMMHIVAKIMAEVIEILKIVTKEVKRGRASESIADNTFPVADKDSEKYLRKLIGRKDIKEALRRLDRLTQEEARMLALQAHVTRDAGIRAETVNNKGTHIDDVVLEGAFVTLATHPCHCKHLYK